MVESKRELRDKMRLLLSKIAADEFKIMSESLSLNLEKFINHLEQQKNQKFLIGAFYPERRLYEPIWYTKLGSDKSLGFPRRVGENGMVYFHSGIGELSEDEEFGVKLMLPPKNREMNPDLLLVPGLAFDKSGARLGRGKGFYDSYLKDFDGISVGVAFSSQIVQKVPTEKHDRPLNFLVTENGVVELKSNG